MDYLKHFAHLDTYLGTKDNSRGEYRIGDIINNKERSGFVSYRVTGLYKNDRNERLTDVYGVKTEDN